MLDIDKIKLGLPAKRIGREVIVFGSVTSTSDIAAEYANNMANDGLVIFAEQQTAGRGRGGNKWLSQPDMSVMCSILLINEPVSTELLSLTSAVATAESIGSRAKVKWPNDVIYNGKKIAGILLETKQFETHRANIIGIGINCHQNSFAGELESTATSIDIENHCRCDRTAVARRLLTSFEHHLDIAGENTQKIIDKWQQLTNQLGRRITFTFDGKKFAGNCIGLDPDKGLIVQLDSGARRFFPASQTSIVR